MQTTPRIYDYEWCRKQWMQASGSAWCGLNIRHKFTTPPPSRNDTRFIRSPQEVTSLDVHASRWIRCTTSFDLTRMPIKRDRVPALLLSSIFFARRQPTNTTRRPRNSEVCERRTRIHNDLEVRRRFLVCLSVVSGVFKNMKMGPSVSISIFTLRLAYFLFLKPPTVRLNWLSYHCRFWLPVPL